MHQSQVHKFSFLGSAFSGGVHCLRLRLRVKHSSWRRAGHPIINLPHACWRHQLAGMRRLQWACKASLRQDPASKNMRFNANKSRHSCGASCQAWVCSPSSVDALPLHSLHLERVAMACTGWPCRPRKRTTLHMALLGNSQLQSQYCYRGDQCSAPIPRLGCL